MAGVPIFFCDFFFFQCLALVVASEQEKKNSPLERKPLPPALDGLRGPSLMLLAAVPLHTPPQSVTLSHDYPRLGCEGRAVRVETRNSSPKLERLGRGVAACLSKLGPVDDC